MPAFFEFYGKGHGELIPSLPWERKRQVVNDTHGIERKSEMTRDSLLYTVGAPVIIPERTQHFKEVGTFFKDRPRIKMWDMIGDFIGITEFLRTLGPAPERTYLALGNREQVTMQELISQLPPRYQSNLADAAYLIELQINGEPGLLDTSGTRRLNTFFLEGKNQREVVLSADWYEQHRHWSIELHWREDIEGIRANMANILVPKK